MITHVVIVRSASGRGFQRRFVNLCKIGGRHLGNGYWAVPVTKVDWEEIWQIEQRLGERYLGTILYTVECTENEFDMPITLFGKLSAFHQIEAAKERVPKAS